MKSKLKGFTLIELIVVLAIIAVLGGLLVPNMLNTLRKSKLSSANENAKSIFNAAQTIMQQYEFQNDPIKGNTIFSVDGTLSGTLAYVDANKETSSTENFKTEFSTRLKKYYSEADNTCWSIYADGFIVKAVAYAPSNTDIYVGLYPCIPGVSPANTKGATLDYTKNNKRTISYYDESVLPTIASTYYY